MLNNQQVIDIIRVHRKDAFGPESSELTAERAEALDRYHGRPYGDEEDGYSKFVTKDLAEAVDWALAPTLRPFIQSGVLAEFKPRNKQDEEQVEIESKYVNHLIMEDNNGVILLHDCFKDAFILKNCYVKHSWNETKETIERSWEGINELELARIWQKLQEQGHDIEVKESEYNEDGTVNITIQIVQEFEGVKIDPVPPEELRISNRCRGSLQDSPFVEHIPPMTRSDLIEMGVDKNWLMSQPAKGQSSVKTEERKRDSVSDENDDDEGISLDIANEEMNYAEAYMRIDYDGDGIAELRRIITINDLIPPENKKKGFIPNEVVDVIPFTGGVPKRMPHRHIGESFQDDLADLAEQHTALTRQLFDNVYHTVHNQWAINERVEEEDVLEPGAAAIFRVAGKDPVNGSIEAIRPPSIAGELLGVISHVEERKKKRTGVNEGDLDPDILKQATKGAFIEDLNRKSQKIEMTTRILAETFVKELVLRVHELVVKHQTKPRTISIGGQYMDVDPSTWLPRKEVTVKVGLGTGTTEERLRKLDMLSALQEKLLQWGLVTPQEAYALFVDIAKELGETNPEKFALDPRSPRFQQMMQQRQGQQQPNQLAEAEEVKGRYSLEREKMNLQFKGQIEQMRAQMEQQSQAHDQQMEEVKAFFEAQITKIKEDRTHEHQMHELRADMEKHYSSLASNEAIAQMKEEIKALVEGFKIDLGRPGIGAGVQEKTYDPMTGNFI